MIYKIPLLLIISYRGYQGNDAPEHLIMGDKITKLLEDLGIPAFVSTRETLQANLDEADEVMEKQKVPAVMLIREKIFG